MAERKDLPKIKSKEKPSYFNREMLDDAVLVNVLGPGFLWDDLSKTGKQVILGITAVGAVYGGWRGKRRMEEEQRYGKWVKDPSYLNTGAAVGATMGLMGAEAVDLIKGKRILGLTGLLASTAIGMAIGSIIGKQQMETELQEALALKQQQYAMAHPPVPHIHNVVVPAHASTSIDAATANDAGTVAQTPEQKLSA